MFNGYRTLAAIGRILGVSEQRVLEFIEHGPLVARELPEGLMVRADDLENFRRPRAFEIATTRNKSPPHGSEMLQDIEPITTTSLLGSASSVTADYRTLRDAERWAPVPGSDRHEVSTLGRLRTWRVRKGPRLSAPVVVKPRAIAEGYLGFAKQSRLHTAVLEAFVGPCPEGHEAAHFDGDKHNNALSNLRWATHAENIADKVRHGTPYVRRVRDLDEDETAEVCRRREAGESRADVAKAFGITPQTVSRKTTKSNKSHLRLVAP